MLTMDNLSFLRLMSCLEACLSSSDFPIMTALNPATPSSHFLAHEEMVNGFGAILAAVPVKLFISF